MPVLICRNCGRKTNTALCDHMDSKDDKADKCYAAFVDGKWVKGCGYNDCWCKEAVDEFLKLDK